MHRQKQIQIYYLRNKSFKLTNNPFKPFKTQIMKLTKIFIAVAILAGSFSSCKKDEMNDTNVKSKVTCTKTSGNSAENIISGIKIQRTNITLNFAGGRYTSSDAAFINAIPNLDAKMKAALASGALQGASGNVVINTNGTIVNSTVSGILSGSSANDFLINKCDFSLLNEDLTITVTRDGVTMSNNDVLSVMPASYSSKLNASLQQVAENLPADYTAIITVTPTGVYTLNVIDQDGNPAEQPNVCEYASFTDCVGTYWWAPGAAQIACAIGCLAANMGFL